MRIKTDHEILKGIINPKGVRDYQTVLHCSQEGYFVVFVVTDGFQLYLTKNGCPPGKPSFPLPGKTYRGDTFKATGDFVESAIVFPKFHQILPTELPRYLVDIIVPNSFANFKGEVIVTLDLRHPGSPVLFFGTPPWTLDEKADYCSVFNASYLAPHAGKAIRMRMGDSVEDTIIITSQDVPRDCRLLRQEWLHVITPRRFESHHESYIKVFHEKADLKAVSHAT